MKSLKTKQKSRSPQEVLVVAHDAGGAEIIAALIVKKQHRVRFHVYAAGPGEDIFRRENIPFSRITENRVAIARIIKKNAGVAYALLGARWRTHIESLALEEAKKNGMRTVVYLDSWTNYRERFGYPARDWKDYLPDALWVGDTEALSLARSLFGNALPITLVPNEYFRATKARFNKAKKGKRPATILFLTDTSSDSFHALRAVLGVLSRTPGTQRLFVRLHPSDTKARYATLKKTFPHVGIAFSRETDLSRDLVQAKAVVGVETVALAVAEYCGVPVICFAPRKKDILLPSRGIVRVRTVAELAHSLASFV